MNSRDMGWHIKKIVLAHLASLFLDKGNLYPSRLFMWTINNSIEFENQEFFVRKVLERPQEKIFSYRYPRFMSLIYLFKNKKKKKVNSLTDSYQISTESIYEKLVSIKYK